MKESEEVEYDKLRFIRIFTPSHIPKELIEQVRDREYEVDDWYKYQEVICMRNTKEGPQLNPLSLLYVIADEGNKVVGMLWCEIEPLSKALVLQTFSMNKAYWNKGKAVELVTDKIKEILRECKLKKAYWFTNYPKHSQRYGFSRSKSVLMEYTENVKEKEDGSVSYGRTEAHGGCQFRNPRSDAVPCSSDTGDGSASEPSSHAVVGSAG